MHDATETATLASCPSGNPACPVWELSQPPEKDRIIRFPKQSKLKVTMAPLNLMFNDQTPLVSGQIGPRRDHPQTGGLNDIGHGGALVMSNFEENMTVFR